MANKELPKWAKNKLAYTKEYNKTYQKEKMKTIAVNLFMPRDDERIATWKSIPKKADFMRQVLDMYAAGELEIK